MENIEDKVGDFFQDLETQIKTAEQSSEVLDVLSTCIAALIKLRYKKHGHLLVADAFAATIREKIEILYAIDEAEDEQFVSQFVISVKRK